MKTFREKYFNSIMPLLLVFNYVTIMVSEIVWLWGCEKENAKLFTIFLILSSVSILNYAVLKVINMYFKEVKWLYWICLISFVILFIIECIVNIRITVLMLANFALVLGICCITQLIGLVSRNSILKFSSLTIAMVLPLSQLLGILLIESTLDDRLKLIISMFFMFGTLFFARMEDSICFLEQEEENRKKLHEQLKGVEYHD